MSIRMLLNVKLIANSRVNVIHNCFTFQDQDCLKKCALRIVFTWANRFSPWARKCQRKFQGPTMCIFWLACYMEVSSLKSGSSQC